MTGHGEGQADHSGGGTILAEVRSVNNRHLKVHVRTSEGLGSYDSAVEALVRSSIRRGSVQLSIHWRNRPSLDLYHIQPSIAESYLRQCREISDRLGMESRLTWSDLVNLPGVVSEPFANNASTPELESAVLNAVEKALASLESMRASEGAAMERELGRQLSLLQSTLEQIDQRAPQVLSEYRHRLRTRVVTAIAEALAQPEGSGVSRASPSMVQTDAAPLLQDTDLVREVALMADRSDVREEIVRLQSHFSQFGDLLLSSESQGRRLDFLVQEMFREANTIGSKASDAMISQHVVEIKAILEQVREMIQNVE